MCPKKRAKFYIIYLDKLLRNNIKVDIEGIKT